MKKYSHPPDLRAFGILVLATMAHFPSSQGANLLVYNTQDSGAGTLRQAILDNKNLGGGNTITFSNVVTGTMLLTTGELLISNNVTILGPGANVLAVNGNAASRVFHITSANASISGLTITNGLGVGGGGILNENSTLMMSACILNGNSATNGYGGGIYNYYSTLTVSNCTISGNSAYDGGGIYNDDDGGSGTHSHGASATLTLIASTISGNSASVSGGGVFNWATYNNDYTGSATVTLSGCTFSGNLSAGDGGGIYNYASFGSATLTISNCTFSGNSSGGAGGGIVSYSDYNDSITTVKVIASTFSGNSAPVFADSLFIYSDLTGSANLATLELGNTIMKAGTNIYNSGIVSTVISDGYNLSSDGGGGFLHGTGDQINTDPKLGPLQDNGGPTLTQAPLPGSPAIDQGKSFGLTTDQRGHPRPFDNPGTLNAIGGDGSDIGAVEAQTGETFPILVTNTNDNGPGSLRQALSAAVAGITIAFQSNVIGTIKLTSGELLVTNNLNILGPGANGLAVNGNAASRAFHLTNATATISGLTLTNCHTNGGGGAIFNDHSVLTVSNCVVTGNSAGTSGGGIYNNGSPSGSSTLNLIASTFSGNAATNSGGAIFNTGQIIGSVPAAGIVTIKASTIASNSAASGGGIYSSGRNSGGANATLTILGTTLAGNSATSGGGIYLDGSFSGFSKLEIGDSILQTGATGANIFSSSGTVGSDGYNLSSDNGLGLLAATGDQINTAALLGPLRDNGGPTPTMAPLSDSPAIDKGKSFGLTTDQRGAPRPYDFASLANASGGDGSDIGAFELGRPTLNILKISTNAVLSWPSYYGDFTLQSVTNVTASNSWAAVVGTPAVVADQYVLTNGPVSANKFYRLKSN